MRKYLSKGTVYTDSDAKREILENGIKALQWFTLPVKAADHSLPFSQGEGIRAMIEQRGWLTDKVAYGQCQHGAILAIQNNYHAGVIKRVILYCIDTGCSLVPVAVDEFSE